MQRRVKNHYWYLLSSTTIYQLQVCHTVIILNLLKTCVCMKHGHLLEF
jgi:hypothetical protein